MRIYTKLEFSWNGTEYTLDKSDFFEYNGPIAHTCGASSQQQGIEQSQQNFMNQLQQQASQVFGASSQLFQNLQSTFMPIIKAGPNQQGFSPAELSAMNSQAITGAGQAYKNAKSAVGNEEAAFGGGNVTLPSGVNTATDLGLAEGAANLTSQQLNQITQENYAVGRQNYQNAVQGAIASPGVFSPASSMAGQATGAGEAAANTANQIAQENNSWMSGVSGILGSVAGAATGGLTNKLLNTGAASGGGNPVSLPTGNLDPAVPQ